jgi:hypothetical protein
VADNSSCSLVGFRVWSVEELAVALLVVFEGAIVNLVRVGLSVCRVLSVADVYRCLPTTKIQ